MLTLFRRFSTFLLSLLFFVAPPLYAEGARTSFDCLATAWPHEQSEFDPDPELYFGRLDNGFRYVLKQNREPADRVGLFLNVQVGSIHEKENQRGIAHFLEHMLFNGTTNFEPGALIEYFQTLGMSFGGDTNAHTTHNETVYKVILPSAEKSALDKGLLVMSDYARGALLLESEVERERGVILAEMLARDSAAYRAHQKKSSFALDGTLIPLRAAIGDKSVLQSADSQLLRDFYQTWYRPDNMILVVVGDFASKDVEDLILKYFQPVTLQNEDVKEPICPDYGEIKARTEQVFYHYEPELGYTDVFLEVVTNTKRQHDSLTLRRENLQQLMISRIINHRLEKLVEQSTTSFTSSYYYGLTLFDRIKMVRINARTGGETWRQTLNDLEGILRQVLRYGFSQEEVTRVKKEVLNDLDNAVLTKDTRNSLHLANTIINHLNSDRVMQSPEQETRLYTPMIKSVTDSELHDRFKGDWQNEDWLVQIIGDARLPGPDEELYLAEYVNALQKKQVLPPDQGPALSFPYLENRKRSVGPEKEELFADLGMKKFSYANGMILNVKKTDFKKNMVSVSIRFGDGKKGLLLPGLDLLAAEVVNRSGTGRLTRTGMEEVLSGSSVHYGFGIGEDSFNWEGSSVSGDLELLFQVLQAVILDPGFRPEAYDLSMRAVDLMYLGMERDIYGKLRTRVEPFLAGNKAGFGLPDRQQFQSLTLKDVTAWLQPYFNQSPLEISVAGDIDETFVEELTSRYFGSIGQRDYQSIVIEAPVFPAGESLTVQVDSSFDKSILRLAWLTDDFWDISRSRRMHILAAVLEDRLRKVIRESLGSSYSPTASSTASRVYPGFGMLTVDVVADNELLDAVRQEVLDVAASLVQSPVDKNELDRAISPVMTSLKETVRTNSYWLYSVMALSSRYPQQLTWPTQMIKDYSSITSDELNLLARTYLRDSRRATTIVRPADPSRERSVGSFDAGLLIH